MKNKKIKIGYFADGPWSHLAFEKLIEDDSIEINWNRLDAIIDQLETFISKQYTVKDYERFLQAAKHNQNLLELYEKSWPLKLAEIKQNIRLT